MRLVSALARVVRASPAATATVAPVAWQDARAAGRGPPRGEGRGGAPLLGRVEADAVGAHAGAVRRGPRGVVRPVPASGAAPLPKETAATEEGKGVGRVAPPAGGRRGQVAGAPPAPTTDGQAAPAEARPGSVAPGHPDTGGHRPDGLPANPLSSASRPSGPGGVRLVLTTVLVMAKAAAAPTEVRPGVQRPVEAEAVLRPRPPPRVAPSSPLLGALGEAAPSGHWRVHATGPVKGDRKVGVRAPVAAGRAARPPEPRLGPNVRSTLGTHVPGEATGHLPLTGALGPVTVVSTPSQARPLVEVTAGPFARGVGARADVPPERPHARAGALRHGARRVRYDSP